MKNRLVITGLCASAFCRSAFYSALDDCDTEKVVLNEGLNILRGEIDGQSVMLFPCSVEMKKS